MPSRQSTRSRHSRERKRQASRAEPSLALMSTGFRLHTSVRIRVYDAQLHNLPDII